jgi:hypothetical protein
MENSYGVRKILGLGVGQLFDFERSGLDRSRFQMNTFGGVRTTNVSSSSSANRYDRLQLG